MARIGGRIAGNEDSGTWGEEKGSKRKEIGVDPWRNGLVRVRDLNWDKGSRSRGELPAIVG